MCNFFTCISKPTCSLLRCHSAPFGFDGREGSHQDEELLWQAERCLQEWRKLQRQVGLRDLEMEHFQDNLAEERLDLMNREYDYQLEGLEELNLSNSSKVET